ncbi:MAG: hypothetical protein QM689_03460 [Oscillospiraceae bacterium]
MRKRVSNVLLGLIFICAGMIFLGNTMDWWDVDLFFDGWWTLFIIIPSVLGMIDSRINILNAMCAFVGIMLLLNAQDLVENVSLKGLILTFLLIAIGLHLIFRPHDRNKHNWDHPSQNNGSCCLRPRPCRRPR